MRMCHGTLDATDIRAGWYPSPSAGSGRLRHREHLPGLQESEPEHGLVVRPGPEGCNPKASHLSDYVGVCVSAVGSTDLCGWVGGMTALCDSNSLQPSLIGQEMGHGYGLDHARREGSTQDYQDPWDVMSTAGTTNEWANNTDYVKIGPGLNAWNMRARGWLDESRVWTADPMTAWDVTIELRPLHHQDLPGYLAAELGPYLVEMRVPEKWDSAIPRACVLVHRFEDNHSYLEAASDGVQDLVEGHRFAVGSDAFPYLAPLPRWVQSGPAGAEVADPSAATQRVPTR